MQDDERRMKIVMKNNSQVPIGNYKLRTIDPADIQKFDGSPIPPEAVLLHEVVEQWQLYTTRPQMTYTQAKKVALQAEEMYTGLKRISDPPGSIAHSTPGISTTYVWRYQYPDPDGRKITMQVHVTNGNVTSVNWWPDE